MVRFNHARLWKKDAVRNDWAVNMNKTDLSFSQSQNLEVTIWSVTNGFGELENLSDRLSVSTLTI